MFSVMIICPELKLAVDLGKDELGKAYLSSLGGEELQPINDFFDITHGHTLQVINDRDENWKEIAGQKYRVLKAED